MQHERDVWLIRRARSVCHRFSHSVCYLIHCYLVHVCE